MRQASLCSWTALVCLYFVPTDKQCESLEIRVPVNYTVLSGDLEIHLLDVPSRYNHLQLLQFTSGGWTSVGSVPLPTQVPGNTSDTSQVVEVKFRCGVITQGGKYGVRLRMDRRDPVSFNSVLSLGEHSTEVFPFSTAKFVGDDATGSEELQVHEIDVRWPSASLSFSTLLIQTYPEKPVSASLMFQKAQCEPAPDTVVPETWLDLLYCGHSPVGCTHSNSSHKQLLYSEQIRTYPELRVVELECNIFGLAGHYALALRTDMHYPGSVIASSRENESLKAEWSEKFVFNVHARSIFPCDAHGSGVSVLFQYPPCILSTGDKVRLFARQRADVSTVVAPSLLKYVTERKITKGKHSLQFECDLFTEKYFEYCFVYVSQALTGAVSDVRMDCVPTLPVSEKDSGQWGRWSEWTKCTTTCLGGTRNRFRFCDNPPPHYGGKFCEGHALETEQCGHGTGMECQYFINQGVPSVLPADLADSQAEIGPGCRCGCVMHLGVAKPRRPLGASSQSCPGRTFWLVQADKAYVVMLMMEHFRLSCPSQWLKIRDGDSLSSKLLTVLSGTPLHLKPIFTTGPFLLLEFFSDELMATGEECVGGFLAYAEQIDPAVTVSGHSVSVSITPRLSVFFNEMFISHLIAAVLLAVVTTASLCLLVQYFRRYSKYQRAAAGEEIVTDHSEEDETRRCIGGKASMNSRPTSTSTLFSEVMPLQRLSKTNNNHKPLEEDGNEIDESVKTKHSEWPANRQILEKAYEIPVNPPVHRQIRKPGPHMLSDSSLKSSCKIQEAGVSPSSSVSRSDSKAMKDRKNWERMMAGSELSLTGGDTDLEMDYYDYNVQNASAAPGSYLGMDPAFCLWIPPFAPGKWDDMELHRLNSKSDHDSITDSELTFCPPDSNLKAKSVENSSDVSSAHELESKEQKDAQEMLCSKLLASSVQVHQAFIIKEKETRVKKCLEGKAATLLPEDDVIKFADDDADDDEYEDRKDLIKSSIKEALCKSGG